MKFFVAYPVEYSSYEEWICSMYKRGDTQQSIGNALHLTERQVNYVIERSNRDALLAFRSRVVS